MPKRIFLLADISSSHTQKWAIGLALQGFSVGLFSLHKSSDQWHKNYPSISVLYAPAKSRNVNFLFNKLKYLFVLPKLKKALRIFKPDILHAHYASSYGLLGALSKFSPFVLSMWGSDVFDFPKKSIFHRFVLKYNLKCADRLLVTSFALKKELQHYTAKTAQVIAFGVDTDIFCPKEVKPKDQRDCTHIGLIKSLEEQYGISTVLNAIKIVKERLPAEDFKLYLIGGGNLKYYKCLVDSLKLNEQVIFTGKVPFKKTPYYHNLLDIFLNVSSADESFGVAVIEAMACEKPVIVSDAPGLLEITNNDAKLAFVITKNDVFELSNRIIELILSPELRTSMGKAARKHVINNYDFKSSIQKMIAVYKDLHQDKQRRQLTHI
jgi:glycosyltransferase involved in cell wall biosynthesis